MSRRRYDKRTLIRRSIVLGVIIAALLALVFLMGRFMLNILNVMRDEDSSTLNRTIPEEDAIYSPTRPPELQESGEAYIDGEDASLNWVYETLTPVDKTAGQLAREESDPH